MPKSAQYKVFSYKAQHKTYLGLLIVLGFLVLVEEATIVLLVTVLVHNWLLASLLHILSIGSSLFVLTIFITPFWTRHRLSDTTLLLHYGFLFKTSIPRTAINEALPVRKEMTLPLVPRLETENQRIIASLGEENQVLLRLDRAYPFRVGFSKGMADCILINVDQRELFLDSLEVVRDAIC